MARSPSDKPAKTDEEKARAETEVNHNDPSVETSINPLDSSSTSSSSSTDWYLGSDSVSWSGSYESCQDDNEVSQFDDEEEGFNIISDWVISQVPRPSTKEEIPVNVAMLPVGVVLSVKGKKVMIEGKEKHRNLLRKDSLLWITETRVPLGSVNEVFVTGEKRCYSVRLESGSKWPEGINQGTQVSIIVTDSAQHDKKGCDASSSGDDTDKFEYLDDETEAEYRKMQKKMAKLGMTSEQKPEVLGLGRKSKNQRAEEQTLPSPNLSDSPGKPQAIARKVLPYESQMSSVMMPQAIPSVPQKGRFAAKSASCRPEMNQQTPIQPPILRKPSVLNPTMYSPQDFRSEMFPKPQQKNNNKKDLCLGQSKNRRAKEQTVPSPNLSDSPVMPQAISGTVSQMSPVMMPQAIASVPKHQPFAANAAPSRPEINQQNAIQMPVMYSPQDFRSEMLPKGPKPRPELMNFNSFPSPTQVLPHRHTKRHPKLNHRGGGRGFIARGKGRDQQQKP